MRVIFLDIDGVLNTSKTFTDVYNQYKNTKIMKIEIDLHRVELLKKVVDKTGAVIVLSSSWRLYGYMQNGVYTTQNAKMLEFIGIFKQYGLSVYDITPVDLTRDRGKEIKLWLQGHDVDSFVIIDDEINNLKEYIGNGLIRTNFFFEDNKNASNNAGLCESHADKAIEYLNRIKNKGCIRR